MSDDREYYATMFPAAVYTAIEEEADRLGVDFDKVLFDVFLPRPITEYHEDMGPVLWWKFPIEESPYVGTPNDLGQEVVIRMPTVGHCFANVDRDFSPNAMKPKKIKNPGGTFFVGGWPGYHTHWTPLPKVKQP